MKMMMECGHAANATNRRGDPSCAICVGIHPGAETPVAPPNLEGRFARCMCLKTVPSRVDLAFFEYRGPESNTATSQCAHCGYFQPAHDPEYMARLAKNRDGSRRQTVVEQRKCTGFVPCGGKEFDLYYCGCRGWD